MSECQDRADALELKPEFEDNAAAQQYEGQSSEEQRMMILQPHLGEVMTNPITDSHMDRLNKLYLDYRAQQVKLLVGLIIFHCKNTRSRRGFGN